MPGVGRAAGTGGDDEPVGRERLRLVGGDRVVPVHDDLGAELLEQVHEVVGERVVVVDHRTFTHAILLLREVDRRFERGELAQALLVLGGRVGVVHDPGARLEVRDAVGHHDRAQRDARVHRAAGERVERPRRRTARGGIPRARR